MKILKNAFELYINSSLHVAIAIVSLTLITYLEYEMKVSRELLFFIFFSSITGYNFVKYAGIAQLHHSSLAANLRFIQIFSLASFISLVYFAFQMSMEVLIATGILGLFTILYAIPVFGKGKNLRSLSGLKIFIIALVWAGSTVLLPLIDAEMFLGIDVIVDFLQRLFLVIVLTLPFELRDLNYDASNLGTIPQRIGVRPTKIFGTVLLMLIMFSELFQKSFDSKEFLSLNLMLVVTGIFLWRSRTEQSKYFASFWVEALPIFYLGIYLLIEAFLPDIAY